MESSVIGRGVRAWRALMLGLLTILVAGWATEARAAVRFVKADAAGANNGSSWANAYTDIQAALAVADWGDEIWVAAGTYKPTTGTDKMIFFVMVAGVGLYGGFVGTEIAREQRDWQANKTILSGDIGDKILNEDNSYHVVVGSNNAVLDGFTITGGASFRNDENGGGMINDSVSPTIANCIFTGNSALGAVDGGKGGGMANLSSSPTVRNCTFTSNTSIYNNGGGMYNENASPTVINCSFIGNTSSDGSGGGMYILAGSPTINNCTFAGNMSNNGHGGGIYNLSGSPTVTNCTFSDNKSSVGTGSGGGGMGSEYGWPTIVNCTFSGNAAGYGGGINLHFGNPSTVTNCTFRGNTASYSGGGMDIYSGNPSTVTNCTFSGNMAVGGGGMAVSHNSSIVINCIYSGNTARIGGGMLNGSYASTKIINCTYTGNTAGEGGGMNNDFGSPTVNNCILWGDLATHGSEIYKGTSISKFYHCDIQGSGGSGAQWDSALGTDGGGNIDADPLFMDATNPAGADGLWRTTDDGLMLKVNSPCINAGTSTGAPIKDILDQLRNGAPDLGAYEYQVPKNGVVVWTYYP